MMLRIVVSCFILCLYLPLQAQQQLHIHFMNVAGDSLLTRGATYTNAFGESITINNFKYYVSNLQLQDENGIFHSVSNEYFLINLADSASLDIQLQHPLKRVKAVKFLLGVDSIRNVSGIQSGALDPLNGMFWMWNSGYIMARLEGKSAASKAKGNYCTYHVGGFAGNENAARWVTLSLPSAIQQASYITVKADALKWFYGAYDIKIADIPVCHEPGATAMHIADNYARMFSIVLP